MVSTGSTVTESPEKQVVPYERMYGVLAQTNVETSLSDRRRIGGGGMRTTVPDLTLLSEDLDLAWYLAIEKSVEALLLLEGYERLAQTSGN
jgi:hypothetical protein